LRAPPIPFGDAPRPFGEGRFWFQEALHAPEPLYPFGALVFEWTVAAVNQASARLFAVPPSLGVEFRLLNRYVYDSPTSVTDEATLARRTELFKERGGYYYEHWHELYDSWVEKVQA